MTDASLRFARYWPSGGLAAFVEHYWVVRWDLGEPRVAETVPHPSVHMVMGPGRVCEIVGAMRTKFSRVLAGRGRVVVGRSPADYAQRLRQGEP